MEERRIYWLDELNQHDQLKVGRKCANLGEMTRVGLPVPPGFALTIHAFNMFLRNGDLNEKIASYLKNVNYEDLINYGRSQEISRNLRTMFEEQELPSALTSEISRYYREMAEKCQVENLPVAVRSSGPVSMPGQFETYLNVRGEESVMRQIIRCWSSTFTPRAIAYRIQKDFQQPLFRPHLGMAESRIINIVFPIGVAVLKMVNARVSGVAFTVHPTTGDRDKIVIEGSWGLGESVVGGDISPDRFVVDKKTFQIESAVNRKTKQLVLGREGTNEVEVPPDLQKKACLTEKEVEKIARLALQIEGYYGVPQDMEWAIDQDLPENHNLLLLQTRAVSKIVEHKDVDSKSIVDMLIRNVFKR